MKRILILLLSLFGFGPGCSKQPLITHAEFTREYAAAVKGALPDLDVVIVKDLEVKVTHKNGGGGTAYLENAFDMYKKNPKALREVIAKYVSSSVETFGQPLPKLDRSRIVPIIKDRPWLIEVRQGMSKYGAKEMAENVVEDFSDDLVIVYAEDTPTNIKYLCPEDLEGAEIKRDELRKLAGENLKQLLPKVECHHTNGLYRLTAGGDYDASLLTVDAIWKDLQIDVNGEMVVAIPTRDMLLIAGSKDLKALENMKQMAAKAWKGGTYRITPVLHVLREGRFQKFAG